MKIDPETLDRMIELFDKETKNDINIFEAEQLHYLILGFSEALAREVKGRRLELTVLSRFMAETVEIMDKAQYLMVESEDEEDAEVWSAYKAFLETLRKSLPIISAIPRRLQTPEGTP